VSHPRVMGAHLVLVGGGHAHLFVLEGLARGRFPGDVAVTLVAPDPRHAYSGMVPGLVGGRYRPDDLLIDLAALARAAGATFIAGAVESLDPGGRSVRLADGRRLSYDILSLAVGSGNAGTGLPGVEERAVLLKPIDRTLGLVPAVERAAAGAGTAVAVVGGGAAGVELALNLRTRLAMLGRGGAPVRLVDGDDRVLRDRSGACRRAAERVLRSRGIELILGREVARLADGRLHLDDGRTVEAGLVVWATGPSAPRLFADTALALDQGGYLRVDPTLRSVSHPGIFAAGDAAALEGHPGLPKAGVYAVRQGPVLRDNLAAACAGREPSRRFHPQRRFLALLNTGDGRAILSWGALAVTGRWAMALKDRIDRRFMRRFKGQGGAASA
jgi:selenide,water dikinase